VSGVGIHHITAEEVHATGGAGAAESALAVAGAGGARVYLTIDIDCLDPAFAPGTGADEPGGLSSRHVLDMVRVLAPRVEAMDIVEVNPPADQQDQTSTLAAQMIFTAIVAREEDAKSG
jgi:agmatinase